MLVFLLGLYLSATILPSFPGLHDHSGLTAFAAEASHEKDPHGNSGPSAPASHDHENCQICHIQSTLAGSILPSGPTLFMAVEFHSYLLPHCVPCVPQILTSAYPSRGPPRFLSA